MTFDHRIMILFGVLLVRAESFRTTSSYSSRRMSCLKVVSKPLEIPLEVSCKSQIVVEASRKEFVWEKQWYPILPISHLQEDVPKQMTVLGRKLVIWSSGNDSWTVMEDVCPHRRAPLSTGKVIQKTDCKTLMCRFHGWEFDSSGSCVHIPMLPLNSTKVETTKFESRTLHSQVQGGMLWAFLDANESNPPNLPVDSVPDDSEGSWSVTKFPVSYMSMVENSFDPSHAPFIHEGSKVFGKYVYSPQTAIPIQHYGLKNGTSLKQEGFILEHTPYLNIFGGSKSIPNLTTRQFVPPCTQITKSPFFTARLYFVPSTARETIVIGYMIASSKKRQTMFSLLPEALKMKIENFRNDLYHYKQITSESIRRFSAQDTLTMQGQDFNKGYTEEGANHIVLDIAPTPADKGVTVFQQWARRFAGQGPFTKEEGQKSLSLYHPTLSQWDAHSQHCLICQKFIKRISNASTMSQKLSTSALVASVATQLVNIFMKQWWLSRAALGLLTSSCLLKALSILARQHVEQTFESQSSHAPVHRFLFDVYAA